MFLALCSRKDHLHLGGWRSHQRRSYFALQLTEQWWVWAMDAQLDDEVDQPQKDYFLAVAKGMPDNSKIILCGPEPGWLYTLKKGSKSLSVISYVGWTALNQHRNFRIPIVLSGDTHHYSRYVGDDGTTHFITSRGGGAFLHPTHQLEQAIDVDRREDGISWLDGKVRKLRLALDPNPGTGTTSKEARYPTREESLSMLHGNLSFIAYNPGFCILLGAIYWLLGVATIFVWWDVLYIAPLLLLGGFWIYTSKQEGGGAKVFLVSVINAFAHSVAVISLATFVARANVAYLSLQDWPRLSFNFRASLDRGADRRHLELTCA